MSSISKNDKKIKLMNIKNIFYNSKVRSSNDKNDLYANLESARKEWEEAKNIFENVSEPDLVDYAIYNVEAAEKKYIYLLRQIKNEESAAN
ncbi:MULTISPECIES: YaaL family protein [unclassified Sedimentibacter]|uniref:YaaL family protein n=1 Tax=unclassified Sedimentibacter TaxID=2649220 RepID=UPI0027DF9A32|nr:YaaL family protein [Sedimentibacter sp. MB35-C1]WMJ78274.1 YaaL family protein [Sedimentibacter sp. MB35-C1]